MGKVLTVAEVEGSDKLLQFSVDLGPLGTRNIFSGIKPSYGAGEGGYGELVGTHVVVLANLKPRKMRFGLSEGMILASGSADDDCTLLQLDPERSKPGERIT